MSNRELCASVSCSVFRTDENDAGLTPYRHVQVKDTLNPPYQIAAQNSWVKGVGAYTGEIAPELLKVSIRGGHAIRP